MSLLRRIPTLALITTIQIVMMTVKQMMKEQRSAYLLMKKVVGHHPHQIKTKAGDARTGISKQYYETALH